MSNCWLSLEALPKHNDFCCKLLAQAFQKALKLQQKLNHNNIADVFPFREDPDLLATAGHAKICHPGDKTMIHDDGNSDNDDQQVRIHWPTCETFVRSAKLAFERF